MYEFRNRTGQRIGPYRVTEDTGKRTKKGKPVWLTWSFLEGREREVTEHKLIKLGRKYGFEEWLDSLFQERRT